MRNNAPAQSTTPSEYADRRASKPARPEEQRGESPDVCVELLAALGNVERAPPEEAARSLRTLRLSVSQLRARVWGDVASGDLSSPTAKLQGLKGTLRFLRGHAVPEEPPLTAAARALLVLHEDLELARQALKVPLSGQLTNQTWSDSELAVLRVLLSHRGEFLGRKAVHDALGGPDLAGVGVVRVGQILASLFDRELVWREQKTTQGARSGAFYRLTPHGVALCEHLGIDAMGQSRFGFERDERRLNAVLQGLGSADRRRAKAGTRRRNIFALHAPGVVGPSPRCIQDLCRWMVAEGERVLLVDLTGHVTDHLQDATSGQQRIDLRPLICAALDGDVSEELEHLATQLFDPVQGSPDRTRPGMLRLSPPPLGMPGESALRRAWLQFLLDDGARWARQGGQEAAQSLGLLPSLRQLFSEWPGIVLVASPAGLSDISWVLDALLADATALFVSPHPSDAACARAVVGSLFVRESCAGNPHPWGPVIPLLLTDGTDAEDVPGPTSYFTELWPSPFWPILRAIESLYDVDDRSPPPPLCWNDGEEEDGGEGALLDEDGRWSRNASSGMPLFRVLPALMLAMEWWTGRPTEESASALVERVMNDTLDPMQELDVRLGSAMTPLINTVNFPRYRIETIMRCAAGFRDADPIGAEIVTQWLFNAWVNLITPQYQPGKARGCPPGA